MCYQTLTLLALGLSFIGTVVLAVLGVRGLSVGRSGSLSMVGGKPPPSDPGERAKWGARRYWAYRLGLPTGVLLILLSLVFQALALYAPQCK